jgi:hypothetical protein
VRAILDESLPRPLAAEIPGHEVATVRRMGWAGLGNGELLRRMRDAGFGALATADRGIEYQQNIARVGIGLVVLRARSNRIEDVLPLAVQVAEALSAIRPGQIVHVGSERRRRRPPEV